jgi:hypothetical protein
MDLRNVLAQLRSELENLDAAIQSLERLRQTERRRGRPPSWLNAIKKPGRPKGRGKPRDSDGDNRK